MISEQMTMEEFEAAPGKAHGLGGNHTKSESRVILEAMAPGMAIRFSHDGVRHDHPGRCGFFRLAAALTKLGPHRYSVRHLPDGRVAVACFAQKDSA